MSVVTGGAPVPLLRPPVAERVQDRRREQRAQHGQQQNHKETLHPLRGY